MAMRYDLVLRGGSVIDGTRAPRYAADVAVSGGRIAKIGDLAGARGAEEIDAGGRIVAPGFIDAHTHDDRLMLSAPDMAAKVSQGVTTVVAGNCGVSLAPVRFRGRAPTPPLDLLDDSGEWFRFDSFAEYVGALRDAPAATNAALLVGHSTLRCATMDKLERAATPAEIAAMQAIVSEALAAGAVGVSTGLYYEPAAAATTEEVIEVCRPLSAARGLYCTHMRDEADRVVDSLEETFRIGRELGVAVVVSHHKVVGRANYGRSKETLPLIAARMKTQSVCLDCYPYSASSTILTASRIGIASKTLVTWSKTLPQHAGRDLADIARDMGVTPEEAVARLIPAGAIYFSMDEADVQQILAFSETMVGSDGLPHDSSPHPRLWGTFPRVLGHYSRSLGLFPLETAVYKMTGLTAKNYGLEGRGVIREGAHADITVFDAGAVDEAATFDKPIQPARGIDTVIVNGTPVWRGGRSTGARPGRVLHRT
jgi:N-acyl-D-amino-acid deacylase